MYYRPNEYEGKKIGRFKNSKKNKEYAHLQYLKRSNDDEIYNRYKNQRNTLMYLVQDHARKDMPIYGETLGAVDIEFMLWAYEYEFFSKPHTVRNFWTGGRFPVENIPKMMRMGYVEDYFGKLVKRIKEDKNGEWINKDIHVKHRYCLSFKGRRLVSAYLDRITRDDWTIPPKEKRNYFKRK